MNVVVCSADSFAKKAADAVTAAIKVDHARNLCFASGNTTVGVYQELVVRCQSGLLTFANVRAFVLDEWGDGVDDTQRCVYRLHEKLFVNVDIEKANVHFLDPRHPDVGQMCRDYDDLIYRNGGLDLCILGIGLNGHVGFNEPGTSVQDRTRVVSLQRPTQQAALKYGITQEPTWGVTIGLATLMKSRQVLLMANGRHKRDIIAAVVRGDKSGDVPASLFRDHPNCTLLLDTDAASLL